jgi:murein DD-endopeptidase MepM/ murein hydrolase activator NlpD
LTDFGWTRLAYLLAVLSVLAALARQGSPSAEPRPLASEPPDTRPAHGISAPASGPHEHEHEGVAPRVGTASRENPAAPPFARHLKRAIAAPPSASPAAGRAVFYRPPPERLTPAAPEPGSGERQGPGPVCGDLGRFPSGNRLVFPLSMQHANSFEDTWGAPRPQGGHEGTDLMVPTGTPEYAITDGTIVPVIGSNGNGWNSLGGYAVMLRAAYSAGPVREGDLFYYAHLERESALPLGATVRAGQLVGYAGDTGQGPEVTRGLFPPHLHFGWYDATGTRSYLPSGAMNPYPLLEWLRVGGGVLGGGTDARYCEVLRSGAPTPSTGRDRWPAARDPGARPDLDTGSRRPAPSPAVETTRPPVRQAARAEKAAPAKPAPDRRQGASRPPASGPAGTGEPGEPAPRAEPPPRDRAPEASRPATGQSPKDGADAPAASPENQPPGEGSEPPDREPDPGESEDPPKNPDEGAQESPTQPEADREEPEEEEPEGDKDLPDKATTPDEDEAASEPGADEEPEAAPSEAGGSEDPEEPPQETTTEATTAAE